MNLHRGVAYLLASLSIFLFCGFGFLGLKTWTDLESLDGQLRQSHQVLNLAQKAMEGDRQVKLDFQLAPDFRQKTLTDFIKSPRSQTRFLNLVKTESAYQKYIYEMRPELERRMQIYLYLAFAVSVFASALYFLYLKLAILKPLKQLNHRIFDFLRNKYSYEFEAPANNEIGDLHSAFNEMAQKVLDQISALQQLDRAKSEFLSIASHELRTPLTSIKGSLSLLGNGVLGPVSPEATSILKIADQETDRLIRLINELLDLAKIEAGQFPLKKDWHSLSDLVNIVGRSLQGLAEKAQVKISCEAPDTLYANIDHDRIQQVITNLASNAIKFSPEGSEVILRVLADNKVVTIEVEDHGPGIAPEDQAMIFEKFRQATNAENPLVKGTGLGLAIAKAIVEEHGGEISVRSYPNKGSVFYFTLVEWRLQKPMDVAA